MAEENISQWNVPCICDNPAEHHCNTCGDLLCSRCRSLHLKSRASSDHVVVPYAERIEPQNTSFIKCSTHQSKISELWCKTCDTPACIHCVTSSEHKQHEFNPIEDQIAYRRGEFQEKLNVQNNSLLELEKLSSDYKKISVDYEDHVNEIDAAMAERANEIGTEITNILIKHRNQLRKEQSTQTEVLRATEKRIDDSINCIKNENKKIEGILRDRDLSTLLQPSLEETTADHKLTVPALISPTYQVFTTGHIDTRALEQMFGSFAVDTRKLSQNDSTVRPESHNEKEFEAVRMVKESTHEKQQEITNNAQRKVFLITPPSTIFSVTIPNQYMIPFISCCRESDVAWIKTSNMELQLMRKDGKILEAIATKFELRGIDVTKKGDLMILDYTYKCIKSLSGKTITTLFNTGIKQPGGICCLMNGEFLVTFPGDRKVMQYSREGNVVKELDSTFFRCPVFLAQNEITQDMYVCDRASIVLCSPGDVLVFGSSGAFRYKYSGQGDTDFNPRGICTDQDGRVLIIDGNSSRLHVLDKDGQFLGNIDTAAAGLIDPRTIDVDNDGYAWIGCGGKLGVMKYLQYQ